jgi:tryptophan-rich sensory protein
MDKMNTYSWYSQLIKPSWAPPSWLFTPVWMVLYGIIALSFGTVFYKAFAEEIAWMVTLPFVLNLVFNIAFVPIQFGLKNNLLALFDILLVLFTLVWALVVIWGSLPHFHWIVYANIPYFLWVAFATALQLTITFLNK